MTTLYWQIAPELTQLRRQAERILEDRGQTHVEPRPWKPAAELRDLGDRYELQLQLPGVDAGSLDIQATRDSVTVKGDSAESLLRNRPATEAQLIHSEFRTGAFERAVRLPEAVQHQAVSADYSHGLLTLSLPKLTAAPDYRVQVVVHGATQEMTADLSKEAVQPEIATTADAAPANSATNEVPSTAEDLWAEPA